MTRTVRTILGLIPHCHRTRTRNPNRLCPTQSTAPLASAVTTVRGVCIQHSIPQFCWKLAVWCKSYHFKAIVGQYFAVSQYRNMLGATLPKFYDWGGGGVPTWWTFGWETGRDNDLVCVKPQVTTPVEGETALSPSCRNRRLIKERLFY